MNVYKCKNAKNIFKNVNEYCPTVITLNINFAKLFDGGIDGKHRQNR
jgi:hypothetical protein